MNLGLPSVAAKTRGEISRNKRSAHEGTNLGQPPVAEVLSEVRSTEKEQSAHEGQL